MQASQKEIYEILAQLSSALASPARLKIVQILLQAPRTVEDLAHETDESVANTSQHLQRLARAKVVQCERRGVTRIYRLSSPLVGDVWEKIQELGHEILADLDQKEDQVVDHRLYPSVSLDEVTKQVKDSKAFLLDVRDGLDSASSPVPHALALPLKELTDLNAGEQVFKKLGLKKALPVYVFCRGRYCVMASDAVRELRKHGYKAYRLRESAFRLRRK